MFRSMSGMLAAGAMALFGTTQAQAQAQAQDATPAAPAPAASVSPPVAGGCELHVWPAERFIAHTTGLLSGFGVVGAVADGASHADKDKSNRTQIASALDSVGQVDALASLELTRLLGLPDARIVRHDTPLERHTMNKIKTRRAESSAPCYAELIVGDVFYQKAAIYGRSLRTLFLLRDFRTSPTIQREYKAWGGNGLKLFPPKEGEDFQAANDELLQVFKDNFLEFAKNARPARTAAGTAAGTAG